VRKNEGPQIDYANTYQWNTFFFFRPSVITPVYPVKKSPSDESKIYLSPQKPLPILIFFSPDIDANF